MKFFIVGTASSVWIREYVKEIHIKNGHEVYLTVFDESVLQYQEDYAQMGVKLVLIGKNNKKIEKIKKLVRLVSFMCKHRTREEIDVVEIQGPPHNILAYILAILIKFMRYKTFIMFWGSDILAISAKDAKKLEHVVKNANVINRPG